jgi:hypothetical protein
MGGCRNEFGRSLVCDSTGLNWLRIEDFEASITIHKLKRFSVPEDANAFVFGFWFVK